MGNFTIVKQAHVWISGLNFEKPCSFKNHGEQSLSEAYLKNVSHKHQVEQSVTKSAKLIKSLVGGE